MGRFNSWSVSLESAWRWWMYSYKGSTASLEIKTPEITTKQRRKIKNKI
jgi:hypothetical protein